MANININLSAGTIATMTQLGSVNTYDSIAGVADVLFAGSYAYNAAHATYATSVLLGSTLTTNFSDGANSQFTGVTLANPNATSGAATASQLVTAWPYYYSVTIGGTLNYHYDYGANGVVLTNTGGTINDAQITTLLPETSPDYTAVVGNVTLGVHGALTLNQAGDFNGTITSVTTTADRLLDSSTLSGNFNLQGNSNSIGQGLSQTALSGTLDSLVDIYRDGSQFSLTNMGLKVNTNTVIGESLLEDANNLPGNDTVSVTLGSALATPWRLATGAGNDKVTIQGGGSNLSVNAGSGNDVITLGDHNHSVDGGDGTDTAVFGGAMSAYTITKTATGYSVQAGASGVDTLTGIERLQFSDTSLALDISGNGGQVYRLYQAAFNRTPDAGGLGFWINAMDSGATLKDIALEFTKSGEFRAMYGGANPANADFLDKLYHNVLHRAGDQGGFDFWLGHLNAGDLTQAGALAEFGESAENQAALIGSISNGFTFTHYG